MKDVKRASLPLQLMLYYHRYYAFAFFVAEQMLFAYKGGKFPAESAAFETQRDYLFALDM